MLKQLLGSSIMEILKPGCLRNVENGETSLSWIYPRSIGSQCKIKDQRYCVGSKGAWKSLQVTVYIKNTWPSILEVLVTYACCSCHLWGSVRDGGADVGQQEQTGGEAGTLAHFLPHSVPHCQFMFQTLEHLVRMVLYLGCKGQSAVKAQLWQNLNRRRKNYFNANNLTPQQPMRCTLGSILQSGNVFYTKMRWYSQTEWFFTVKLLKSKVKKCFTLCKSKNISLPRSSNKVLACMHGLK